MGERFNLQRVLMQLICTGILDTVRVRASGYIIRKKYEEFAPLYVHPCNLLPEGNPLQGDLDDLEFSNQLKEDAAKSKEVIRLLFGQADNNVPKDETLEGNTMIFIKKLTTIQTLNKRKEDLMVEVVKREKAKIQIAALSLRWLRADQFAKKQKAARKLQASQRMWLSIYGPKAKKGMWTKQITLAKVYQTAVPFAEAWALGYETRRKGGRWHQKKQQAIDDGKWVAGGGGLLKQRKKKEAAESKIDFSKFAKQAETPAQKAQQEKALAAYEAEVKAAEESGAEPPPPPKIVTAANLGAALGAGAAEAEASCPKTSDPSKLPDKMSTRRFIDSQLQVSLVKAVKALHQHRPGPGQVQNFLLKALQGEPLPSVGEKVDADTRIYDYLKQNGAFALLKPALLAVDRHRPDNPQLYIATFMSVACENL